MMSAAELMRFWTARSWRVEREVEDALAGTSASFAGQARFAPTGPDAWAYEEKGQLQAGEHAYGATRRHLYAIESPEIVRVSFDDGRPFYEINCADLPAAAFHHRCKPDEYDGRLWLDGDRWRTEWRVQGPRKDLLIRTSYFAT